MDYIFAVDVNRGVGDEVFCGVDSEVNLLKVDSVWRLMSVHIEVLE